MPLDRRPTEWASELESEVHRHAAEHGLDRLFLHAHGGLTRTAPDLHKPGTRCHSRSLRATTGTRAEV
jgi:hypothetical protein